jgi:hypothetical protein
MIAEAFAFVQFPILPLVKRSADDKVQMFRRNPKLCTPSDFDYSPYFKIIKYPFVDIHYHDDHHLLPWHGTGELDEEENQLYMEAESAPRADEVEEAIHRAIVDSEESRKTDDLVENSSDGEEKTLVVDASKSGIKDDADDTGNETLNTDQLPGMDKNENNENPPVH